MSGANASSSDGPVAPPLEETPLSGERVSPGYAAVRSLSRLLLGLFYERVEVVGGEGVPGSGPLVVAANHHNSVVDALLLLAVVPRRLRTLANAPLFAHPLIGPFLRLLGALPVHRRQEAGNDPARNTALFSATSETLRGGGAILIFPEGRTQPEPVLLKLHTGAARMLLAAEAAPGAAPVTLLPVGLVYQDPGTFRAGRALVVVGRPVATRDLASVDGEEAARTLTDRLAEALRGLFLETGDRETLRLLRLVEELWQAEAGEAPRDARERIDWLQRVVRTYRALRERVPERVAAFRAEAEAFLEELERAGLSSSRIPEERTAGSVARFALREGAALFLGLPLAFLGIVTHALPYLLTGAVVRRIPHTDEEDATDKMAVGLVLYPLLWAAEAFLVHRLGGGWALLAFLAALLPTGFLALAWRERLDRVRRDARTFLLLGRDPGLRRRLLEKRRTLAASLAELARLVPEAWNG